MKTLASIILFSFICSPAFAQNTPFEKTKGAESASYFEAIAFYQQLDKASPKVLVKDMGMTDAGYPLHLVLVSNDGMFEPTKWHSKGKAVIMVNNDIHHC